MNTDNETLRTIQSLHSTHGNFGPKEVSEDDLSAILAASVRAANASARQSYSIVIVRDRDRQKALCGFAGSVGLLYNVDYTRLVDVAGYLGHAFDPSGLTSFITGAFDASIAVQTGVIAARSLGIDSLLTNGVHRGDIRRVYDLLDLPRQYCFPLIMLVLGYAEGEPGPLKGRLCGAGVVHRDRYHRLTDVEMDELVAAYDDPKRHLGLVEDWRDTYAHYLDWFYSVWSVRGPKRTGVTQFQQIAREADFLDE